MRESVNSITPMPPRGSIACVGVGMTLGSHLTPLARSHIQQADVVFVAVSDSLVELWIERMHPDVRSLQPHYGDGKPRIDTYREWVEVMMAEVRAGRRVCAVFYGHPGVFAWSPHKVIRVARAEGFQARMEPGISAEDCLYADLGIDPGRLGCQQLDASQLLHYDKPVDPSGYLVIWQAGVAGNRSIARPGRGAAYRALLVEVLERHYPRDHAVIGYRGATLPIDRPHIRHLRLGELPGIEIPADETLVLPPAVPLRRNARLAERLARLEAAVDEDDDATPVPGVCGCAK